MLTPQELDFLIARYKARRDGRYEGLDAFLNREELPSYEEIVEDRRAAERAVLAFFQLEPGQLGVTRVTAKKAEVAQYCLIDVNLVGTHPASVFCKIPWEGARKQALAIEFHNLLWRPKIHYVFGKRDLADRGVMLMNRLPGKECRELDLPGVFANEEFVRHLGMAAELCEVLALNDRLDGESRIKNMMVDEEHDLDVENVDFGYAFTRPPKLRRALLGEAARLVKNPRRILDYFEEGRRVAEKKILFNIIANLDDIEKLLGILNDEAIRSVNREAQKAEVDGKEVDLHAKVAAIKDPLKIFLNYLKKRGWATKGSDPLKGLRKARKLLDR